MVAEDPLDGSGLLAVVRLRGCAVRVDVLDVRRLHARLIECHLHGTRIPFAFGRRGGDVVGVRGRAVADELAVDLRAALDGTLALLEDEDGRAFRQHEPIAVLVEWPRGLLRGVVAPAHRVHRCERADRQREHRRLRAADHHDIGLAALYQLGALAERVRARRARRHVRQAGPAQVELHRDLRGAGVGHQHRDEKRRKARGSALLHQQDLVDERFDPADAGRDRHADAVTIFTAALQARVVQCLSGRADRVLGEAIGAADLLAVHPLRRVETLDLARDLGLVGGGVEARDACDPASPMHERLPCGRHIEAEWRHRPEAGDHDAAGHDRAAAVRSFSTDRAPAIESGSETFRSFTSAMRFTSPFTT